MKCLRLCAALALAACGDPYDGSPGAWAPPPPAASPPTVPAEQEVVIADVRPPPLSGGTLLVSEDGSRALAADPDRDRILLVDLENEVVLSTIALKRGAEPGRAAEDALGRAHVVLRGGDSIISVDLASGAVLGTRGACRAPRGIAYHGGVDSLYVACVSGALVALPADPALGVSATWSLDRDLRDVVVSGDQLLLSRFRSAEVLAVSMDGSLQSRARPADHRHAPQQDPESLVDFEAAVAWRLAALPGGGAIMMHQRARSSPIVLGDAGTNVGSYANMGDCSSVVVHTAITHVGVPNTTVLTSGTLGLLAMPIDVAVGREGSRLAVVGATNKIILELTLESALAEDGCTMTHTDGRSVRTSGEPIAVGYHPDGRLIVQLREPPMLEIHGALNPEVFTSIALGGPSSRDTGHALFHGDPDGGLMPLACASCHPEGREDGRVWDFGTAGLRRTQSLAHGVGGTAPFHWNGDLADMRALVDEVMVSRMAGASQSDARVAVLQSWLDAVPRVPPLMRVDAAQAARGEALFHDEIVGCDGCHAGPKLTSNETVDVGTGGAFQVPSLLGVGARAPFLHDGCAATLHDRFGACGDDHHGKTSHLTPDEIDDLVAYLEML